MFSSPGFTAIDKTLILSVDLSDHRLPDLTAAQMLDNTTTQRCHHFISASLCPLWFFLLAHVLLSHNNLSGTMGLNYN